MSEGQYSRQTPRARLELSGGMKWMQSEPDHGRKEWLVVGSCGHQRFPVVRLPIYGQRDKTVRLFRKAPAQAPLCCAISASPGTADDATASARASAGGRCLVTD